MPPVSKRNMRSDVEEKIFEMSVRSFEKINRKQDVLPFVTDLFTPSERTMIAKRIAIAFLLIRGDYDQRGIAQTIKVSTNTVARINLILKMQDEGFRKVISRLLKDDVFRIVINDLYEILDPLPHKGANWGKWKKARRERRRKLQPL